MAGKIKRQELSSTLTTELDGYSTHILDNTKHVLSNKLLDSNGNELLNFVETTSAVNEVTITNSATGINPSISATGGDTNIDLNLISKGTSKVKVNGYTIVNNPASAYNTQLTTTNATNIITYTPSVDGNFIVWVYYRVVTAATVLEIICTYTDATGSQTKTILTSASQNVGSYSCVPLFISSTNTIITVTATAGTANNVFISSSISMM
jgi:hypothetical protein